LASDRGSLPRDEGKGGEGGAEKRTALTEESLAGGVILIRVPGTAGSARLVWAGCWRNAGADSGRGGAADGSQWMRGAVGVSRASTRARRLAGVRGPLCEVRGCCSATEEACFKTPACRFAAGRPARYFGNGACEPISRVRGRLRFRAAVGCLGARRAPQGSWSRARRVVEAVRVLFVCGGLGAAARLITSASGGRWAVAMRSAGLAWVTTSAGESRCEAVSAVDYCVLWYASRRSAAGPGGWMGASRPRCSRHASYILRRPLLPPDPRHADFMPDFASSR
jgi:hypothetical protein